MNIYSDIINDYLIGIRTGMFKNESDIKNKFGDKVKSLKDTIEIAKSWIQRSDK